MNSSAPQSLNRPHNPEKYGKPDRTYNVLLRNFRASRCNATKVHGRKSQLGLLGFANQYKLRRTARWNQRGPTSAGNRMLDIAPHPLLDLAAFVTEFLQPLGEQACNAQLLGMLSLDATAIANAHLQSSDEVRRTVRDLLRHGGFKPTGRSKPASEYLIKAATAGKLSPINVAVDACNAVSLHSGLPISVVDFGLLTEPLRIDIAPPNTAYIFNPSGQSIDVGGLLCLCDAAGPCANAVKDSQRTKTSAATTSTLSVIWGTNALPGRTSATLKWYRALLAEQQATTRLL